jgi:hypothetical protein
MSRAISLVFSLAIAVVIAGGLAMPADAQPDFRQAATQANDRASTGSGANQQGPTARRGNASGVAGSSVQQAASTGSKGSTPAHAARTDRRPGGTPTGVKTRATHNARSGHQVGTPPAHAGGPGSSEQAVGVPGTPADELAGVGAPATDAIASVADGTQPGPSPGPATTTQPAPPPVSSTEATAPATAGPAAGPALRAPLVGAWFGHQIHGLLSSPPVLPRPQFGPFETPTAPTAFGLLFGLLGAWYILQRVAWNRLGHVPLTSPPGSGWEVAHG